MIDKIYKAAQSKYIPGHYQLVDSIPVQAQGDGYYNGSFDLKSYRLGAGIRNLGRFFYDSCFNKNDTFRTFIQIRYKNATKLETDSATLIY